jgi:hypothetical protein
MANLSPLRSERLVSADTPLFSQAVESLASLITLKEAHMKKKLDRLLPQPRRTDSHIKPVAPPEKKGDRMLSRGTRPKSIDNFVDQDKNVEQT